MNMSAALEELLGRTDQEADTLREFAHLLEMERRVTGEMAAVLRRIRNPMVRVVKEVGGYELAPTEQVDYFARLAYLNPAAGWVGFVNAGAAGMLSATLPDAGLALLFSQDLPLVSAVTAPTGTCDKVAGGYLVSGRWAFASGAHVADWISVTAACEELDAPICLVLEPNQVRFEDNWYVAALEGTGSVDVIAEQAFVPEALASNPLIAVAGRAAVSAAAGRVCGQREFRIQFGCGAAPCR